MKKAFLLLAALVIIAVVVLVLTRASKFAASPPKTIARIYFAGAGNISGDAGSTAFTNLFCCAQARALEDQTLDKLSRAPRAWFAGKLPPAMPDGSAQLRPLLDDLLHSQWVFQMRDATSSPEYTLAIHLSDARAQLWQTNLRTLLETWTGIKATNVPDGWELKKDEPPNLFRIVRGVNKWLVVGCGQDEVRLADAWASGAESPYTNEMNWLDAKLDWPRLAQIFPVFAKFDLPAMQMQAVGRNGLMFVTGALELSQPLPALDPWQIPTDLVRQPLTSFTAVRGFAPYLERQSWAKLLQLSPEPDQAFIWSLGSSPFQTYVAVPVTNGAAALAQLGQNLATDTNWENHFTAHFVLDRTDNRISLRNFPLITPEVRAVKESSGDFLLADLFANPPFGKAPDELFKAASRTNLVFYHWEMSSERLKELPEPTQLAMVLTRRRVLDPNAAASQWLSHIGPTLGNSVTELAQIGPAELEFKRSASVGLNAFELLALADWLEAPNFPGWDMSLPPRHFPLHHSSRNTNPALPRPTAVSHPPAAPHPVH